MLERCFITRGCAFVIEAIEINDESPRRAFQKHVAVYPRFDNVTVGLSMWVCQAQEFQPFGVFKREITAFLTGAETMAGVRRQARCSGRVSVGSQIWVDAGGLFAVENPRSFGSVVEADHADVDICAVENPRPVA